MRTPGHKRLFRMDLYRRFRDMERDMKSTGRKLPELELYFPEEHDIKPGVLDEFENIG